jgi:phosphoglycerate dehydrogenase-like enzyme
MSEFALALLLALAKRIPHALEQQRAHVWKPYGMAQLEGRTLGILGLGAIGEALATKARALGLRVIGTRRGGEPVACADLVLGPDGTERLLRESDFVVVLLPLTPETRGAIAARELGWLRPTALLVDLARGGIVDEAALAEALRARKLAGAALDVFAEEPLPASSPLWDAPNLILTPHVAGLSPDYMNRLAEIVVENLARVEADRPLVNPVDRARGY